MLNKVDSCTVGGGLSLLANRLNGNTIKKYRPAALIRKLMIELTKFPIPIPYGLIAEKSGCPPTKPIRGVMISFDSESTIPLYEARRSYQLTHVRRYSTNSRVPPRPA